MNNLSRITFVGIFVAMSVFHIYLFISGISLGEEINKFETSTKKLKQNNIDLEKELYSVESLNNAASVAARLKFTKKASPVYLDNLGIALRK